MHNILYAEMFVLQSLATNNTFTTFSAREA